MYGRTLRISVVRCPRRSVDGLKAAGVRNVNIVTTPIPGASKNVIRTKYSSRLYDPGFVGTVAKTTLEDEYRARPDYAKRIAQLRLGQRAGPENRTNTAKKPFVPYYRTKDERFGEPDNKSDSYYKLTQPRTIEELARSPEAFKSWKKQLDDREELQRKFMGNGKGVAADLKLVGSMNEAHPSKWKKSSETEGNKKYLDPSFALFDHGFDIDEDTHHYLLNGTRVPSKFDHWVEDPGIVKSARDLRLLKKIERSKERAAAKHKLRQMGPAQRSDRELEARNAVTRRMLRVNNMLLDEVNNALGELPAYLKSKAMSRYTANKSLAQNLAESNIVIRGNVNFVKVEVTRDLLRAKVFWECTDGHSDLVARELERAAPAMRHLVTQAVNMKYSPELIFIKEVTTQKEQEVNELLKTVEVVVKEYELLPESVPTEIKAPEPPAWKVAVKRPVNAETIILPIQDKLIRSRWISKTETAKSANMTAQQMKQYGSSPVNGRPVSSDPLGDIARTPSL